MKYLLTILLTLGIWSDSLATTTTITSLPYTFLATDMSLTDTDTLVLQGTKLSSTAGGVTLAATWNNRLHDVVLNLGIDTIEFGTAGGDGNVGLAITGTSSYYPYDIQVIGGYILHTPSDTTADANRCITVGGNGISLTDVTAIIRGYNGKVLFGGGLYNYGDTIKGGDFKSEVSGFTSRCQYDATVLSLISLYKSTLDTNTSGAEYHWVVDSLNISGGPHVGINMAGYALSSGEYCKGKITNCTIVTDARNEFYLVNSGLCFSTSNPYGISYRTCYGGLIYNNTITSGSTYGGNRGILIERSDSCLASDPLIIRKNYINVHEGPNVYYGDDLPLHALRIRYGPGNILVDSNTFIGTGDSDVSTKHTGTQVHLIRLTNGIAGVTNVQIKNNRIQAIALDASVSNCSAVLFDGVTADSVFLLSDNNITSSGNIYKFGDFNGESLAQTVQGDTTGYESLKLSSATAYHVGDLGNNYDCSGNIAANGTYLNGFYDTSITFATNGTLDIRLKRTINLTINGNNSLPVNNATVYVVNNLGDTVLNTTTSATGLTSVLTSYWWDGRIVILDSVTYVAPDSIYWRHQEVLPDTTNYEPFTLVAIKSGDTTKTTNFNLQGYSGQRDTTLVLSATEGVNPSIVRKMKGFKR